VNIKEHLQRMESAHSIGNVIEWAEFKRKVLRIEQLYKRDQTKTAFLRVEIKRLNNLLRSYQNDQETTSN